MMKVLLIDATSLVFRAFYAFIKKPLVNSKGMNTSGPFAFVNSLEKLKREINPSHILAVFDAPHKTFRHELYEEYKAQRPKPPDEIKLQIDYVKKLLDAYEIRFLEIEGVEADDVIATFVKSYSGENIEIYISTQDKDLLQLVSNGVYVVQGIASELVIYDYNKVMEKYGVPPQNIPDLLALTGDSIDNIPGVKGIGKKTALELLKKYKNIEGIYEHIDEIVPRIRERLIKYKDVCFFSKRLVILKSDVKIGLDFSEIKLKEPDRKKLARVLKYFEFEKLLLSLADRVVVPFFEESGSMPLNAINGISIDIFDSVVHLIESSGRKVRVPLEVASSILASESVPKYLFDYKSQAKKLLEKGIFLKGVTFDFPLAAYLLEPERGNYNMERFLAEDFLYKAAASEDHRSRQRVFLVHELKEEYMDSLKKMGLMDLYKNIELPLARILAIMEYYGTLIDVNYLKELSKEINTELIHLTSKLYNIAGEKINLNSPKQLAKILFEKLKLPPIKRTKTGYSTNQETLERLKNEHEFVKFLLDYRELYKIKSTYLEPFFKLVDKRGRVHPNFNQMQTATGRLSCSNPNLQNLPIRSDIGKKIRKAVISPPGYLIVSFDYSQIELRITAHLSGEERMVDAFLRGSDIHTETAARIFQKRPEDITPKERRIAKTVNFGIIYGISPYGLSKQLSINVEEAQGIIYNFFTIYPGIHEWIIRTLKETEGRGYTTTLFGRIRRVPELRSNNNNIKELGKRLAINTPVQGSAADIIKKAMVEVHNYIEKNQVDAHMILQIHDELLFEVSEEIVDDFTAAVKRIMENVVKLKVPLKVDFGIGKDWLSAHS